MRPSLPRFLSVLCLLTAALSPSGCGKKPVEKSKSESKDDKDDDDKGKKGKNKGKSEDDEDTDKKAQSTGKEMPQAPAPKKLSKSDAKKLVEDALTEAKKKDGDCNKIINMLAAGVPVAFADDDDAAVPPLTIMVNCAERTKRYTVMRTVAAAILKIDPKFSRPAVLPRAEIYLGNYKLGMEQLKEIAKTRPDDPEVVFTAGLAFGKNKLWPETVKAGTEAVRLAGAAKTDDGKAWAFPGAILQYAGHLHLGEIDKAEKDIDIIDKFAPKGFGDQFRKQLIPVKTNKVYVEVQAPREVYLGAYHLHGKAVSAGHLVEVGVYNFTGKDQQFKVEIEIPGVTEKSVKTVPVLKGKGELLPITPALSSTFDVSAQRAVRKVQINVKVYEGEKVVHEHSLESDLHPRDTLPFALNLGDVQKITNDFIAAWVTPNSKAVEKFLATAKKRLPDGASFSGPQSATVPQIKAIYDSLKGKGYSYVMDPPILAETTMSQRTRLPSEVLASTNAQCVEGAILFATLIEAIGIKAYIIRIPGHAFVGWQPSPGDKIKDPMLFVETTAVHDATFEQAMKIAAGEVAQQVKAKNFDRKISSIIDITAMRAAGITPQPFD